MVLVGAAATVAATIVFDEYIYDPLKEKVSAAIDWVVNIFDGGNKHEVNPKYQ